MKKATKKTEIRELKHEPMPGYKAIFYTVFPVSVIYLAFIMFRT